MECANRYVVFQLDLFGKGGFYLDSTDSFCQALELCSEAGIGNQQSIPIVLTPEGCFPQCDCGFRTVVRKPTKRDVIRNILANSPFKTGASVSFKKPAKKAIVRVQKKVPFETPGAVVRKWRKKTVVIKRWPKAFKPRPSLCNNDPSCLFTYKVFSSLPYMTAAHGSVKSRSPYIANSGHGPACGSDEDPSTAVNWDPTALVSTVLDPYIKTLAKKYRKHVTAFAVHAGGTLMSAALHIKDLIQAKKFTKIAAGATLAVQLGGLYMHYDVLMTTLSDHATYNATTSQQADISINCSFLSTLLWEYIEMYKPNVGFDISDCTTIFKVLLIGFVLTTAAFTGGVALQAKTGFLAKILDTIKAAGNTLPAVDHIQKAIKDLYCMCFPPPATAEVVALKALVDKCSQVLTYSFVQLFSDPDKLQALYALPDEITASLGALKTTPANRDAVLALSRSLGTMLQEVTTRVGEVRQLDVEGIRPDPLPVLLSGPPAVGKTSMITYCARYVADKMGWDNDHIYQLHKSEGAKYYNTYKGEKQAIVDEFLLRGIEDPIYKDFQRICSSKSHLLQGASIPDKKQSFRASVIWMTTNHQSKNVLSAAQHEPAQAVWSRIYWLDVTDPVITACDRMSQYEHRKPDFSHLLVVHKPNLAVDQPRRRKGGRVPDNFQSVTDGFAPRDDWISQSLNDHLDDIVEQLRERELTYLRAIKSIVEAKQFTDSQTIPDIEKRITHLEQSVKRQINLRANVGRSLLPFEKCIIRIQGANGTGKTTRAIEFASYLEDEYGLHVREPLVETAKGVYIVDDMTANEEVSRTYFEWVNTTDPGSVIILATNVVYEIKRPWGSVFPEIVKPFVRGHKIPYYEFPDIYPERAIRRIGLTGSVLYQGEFIEINNPYAMVITQNLGRLICDGEVVTEPVLEEKMRALVRRYVDYAGHSVRITHIPVTFRGEHLALVFDSEKHARDVMTSSVSLLAYIGVPTGQSYVDAAYIEEHNLSDSKIFDFSINELNEPRELFKLLAMRILARAPDISVTFQVGSETYAIRNRVIYLPSLTPELTPTPRIYPNHEITDKVNLYSKGKVVKTITTKHFVKYLVSRVPPPGVPYSDLQYWDAIYRSDGQLAPISVKFLADYYGSLHSVEYKTGVSGLFSSRRMKVILSITAGLLVSAVGLYGLWKILKTSDDPEEHHEPNGRKPGGRKSPRAKSRMSDEEYDNFRAFVEEAVKDRTKWYNKYRTMDGQVGQWFDYVEANIPNAAFKDNIKHESSSVWESFFSLLQEIGEAGEHELFSEMMTKVTEISKKYRRIWRMDGRMVPANPGGIIFNETILSLSPANREKLDWQFKSSPHYKLFVPDTTLVKANSLRGVPLNSDFLPPMTAAAMKINKNLCIVVSENGFGRSYGLFIQDRYLITVAHGLDPNDNKMNVIFADPASNPSKPRVLNFEAFPVKTMRDNDIVLLRVTDPKCPSFTNITKYFTTKERVSGYHSPVLFVQPIDGERDVFHSGWAQTRSAGKIYEDKCQNWRWTPEYVLDFYPLGSTSYDAWVRKGDCGLPLITEIDNVPCIIGMHIGYNASTTLFTVLEKDWVTVPTANSLVSEHDFRLPKYSTTPEWKSTKELADIISPSKMAVSTFNVPNITTIGFRGDLRSFGRLKPHKMFLGISPSSGLIQNCELAPLEDDDMRIVDKKELYELPYYGPSIGLSQAKKYGEGTLFPQYDNACFNRAAEFLTDHYRLIYGEQRLFSVGEVINGVMNSNDPLYGFTSPMRTDTSPGFIPTAAFPLATTKGHYLFNKNEVGSQPYYEIDTTTPHGRFLWRSVNDAIVSWKNEEHFIQGSKACLKVELLPKEKVAKGGTRLFQAVDIDSYIAHGILLGSLVANTKRHRKVGFGKNGCNIYREATEIFVYMNEVAGLDFFGDYSRFDKTLPMASVRAYARTLWHIMDDNVKKEWTIRAFEVAFESQIMAVQCHHGHVYQCYRGNLSGQYDTSEINNYINAHAVVYALCRKLQDNGEVLDSISNDDLRSLFRLSTLGDDNWTRYSYGLQMTFEDMVRYIGEFGLTLTTSSKGVATSEDNTFLSRTMALDSEKKVVWPALKKNSIERVLYYAVSREAEEIASNCNLALVEAVLWRDPKYYEFICKAIREQAKFFKEKYQINVMQYVNMPNYNTMSSIMLQYIRGVSNFPEVTPPAVANNRKKVLIESFNKLVSNPLPKLTKNNFVKKSFYRQFCDTELYFSNTGRMANAIKADSENNPSLEEAREVCKIEYPVEEETFTSSGLTLAVLHTDDFPVSFGVSTSKTAALVKAYVLLGCTKHLPFRFEIASDRPVHTSYYPVYICNSLYRFVISVSNLQRLDYDLLERIFKGSYLRPEEIEHLIETGTMIKVREADTSTDLTPEVVDDMFENFGPYTFYTDGTRATNVELAIEHFKTLEAMRVYKSVLSSGNQTVFNPKFSFVNMFLKDDHLTFQPDLAENARVVYYYSFAPDFSPTSFEGRIADDFYPLDSRYYYVVDTTGAVTKIKVSVSNEQDYISNTSRTNPRDFVLPGVSNEALLQELRRVRTGSSQPPRLRITTTDHYVANNDSPLQGEPSNGAVNNVQPPNMHSASQHAAVPTINPGQHTNAMPGAISMMNEGNVRQSTQMPASEPLLDMAPGIPDMKSFNLTDKSLLDLAYEAKTAKTITIQGGQAIGTIVARLPYGVHLANPWAKAWIKLHKRYKGGFRVHLSCSAVPMVRGKLLIGVVRNMPAASQTTMDLTSAEKLEWTEFNISGSNNFEMTLQDARKNDFFRDVADEPDDTGLGDYTSRPGLVIVVATPLVNQFPDGDASCSITVRTQLIFGPPGDPASFEAFEAVEAGQIPKTITLGSSDGAFYPASYFPSIDQTSLFVDGNIRQDTLLSLPVYESEVMESGVFNLKGAGYRGNSLRSQLYFYQDPNQDEYVYHVNTRGHMDQGFTIEWPPNQTISFESFVSKLGTTSMVANQTLLGYAEIAIDVPLNSSVKAALYPVGGDPPELLTVEFEKAVCIRQVYSSGFVDFMVYGTGPFEGSGVDHFWSEFPSGSEPVETWSSSTITGAFVKSGNTLPANWYNVVAAPDGNTAITQPIGSLPVQQSFPYFAVAMRSYANQLFPLGTGNQYFVCDMIDDRTGKFLSQVAYKDNQVFVYIQQAPSSHLRFKINLANIRLTNPSVSSNLVGSDLDNFTNLEPGMFNMSSYVDHLARGYPKQSVDEIRKTAHARFVASEAAKKLRPNFWQLLVGGAMQGIGSGLSQWAANKQNEKMQGNQFKHELSMQGNQFNYGREMQGNQFDYGREMQGNQFGQDRYMQSSSFDHQRWMQADSQNWSSAERQANQRYNTKMQGFSSLAATEGGAMGSARLKSNNYSASVPRQAFMVKQTQTAEPAKSVSVGSQTTPAIYGRVQPSYKQVLMRGVVPRAIK